MGKDPPRDSHSCPPRCSQENPYRWNKFADGKLLFYNKQLLHIVRHRQDKVVQEFWRVLAICHTVMVQEKDSECVSAQLWLSTLEGVSSQGAAMVLWPQDCLA
jgi:hypothetical protein